MQNSSDLIKIIRNNLDNPDLNVNILADLVNLHRTELIKFTKENFGISPKRLINNLRLDCIFTRTYDYKESIYKVAKSMGIESTMTFYLIIKRRYNKTTCEIEWDLTGRKNRYELLKTYNTPLKIKGIYI